MQGSLPISSRRVNMIMILTALAILLPLHLLSEKIDVGDGFGWDGQAYGGIAKDFWGSMQEVNYRYAQRVVPAGIVHFTLRLFSIELTNPNIIRTFSVLNVLLIALIVCVWGLVADELEVSVRGKWLGFAGLVLNFAVLKLASYYPVATDIPAYAIGMLMLYLYLTGRTGGLCITAIVGGFTWPTAPYVGALLLVFPRDTLNSDEPLPAPYYIHRIVASVLVLCLLLMQLLREWLRVSGEPVTNLSMAFLRPSGSLAINLSILVCLVYVFFGISSILNYGRLFRLTELSSCLRRRTTLLALVLVIGIVYFQFYLSQQGSSGVAALKDGLFYRVRQLSYLGSRNIYYPGIFFVAHVIYFGPVLILSLFLWQSVSQLVHQYGIGVTLCVAFGLVLSLASESRQVINFVPFFVAFTIKATDSLSWRPADYWLIALMSLLLSKVWLTIGPQETDDRLPTLLYFMNHGPWMSGAAYGLQGVAVLVIGCLIYCRCLRRTRSSIRSEGGGG